MAAAQDRVFAPPGLRSPLSLDHVATEVGLAQSHNTASSSPIKGTFPTAAKASFSSAYPTATPRTTHRCSPPTRRHSDRPFFDSNRLKLRQGAPELLSRVSRLKLASSALYGRYCHRPPPTNGERPPPCFLSLVDLSLGYLMSSASSCS
jgi:hypothetical protein